MPCIEITNFVMLFPLAKISIRFFWQHHHGFIKYLNLSLRGRYVEVLQQKNEEASVVNIEIYAGLGQAPKDMPASGQALKDGCK